MICAGLRQQRHRRKDRPGRQQLLCRSELSSRLIQHKGKVVVIDNYDSFTYNLSQVLYTCCTNPGCSCSFATEYGDILVIHLQYLGSLGCEHIVVTNDELTVAELWELEPKGILLSPGPGKPASSAHVPTFHHM